MMLMLLMLRVLLVLRMLVLGIAGRRRAVAVLRRLLLLTRTGRWERLAICTKKLSAGRYTARDCRHGNEGL